MTPTEIASAYGTDVAYQRTGKRLQRFHLVSVSGPVAASDVIRHLRAIDIPDGADGWVDFAQRETTVPDGGSIWSVEAYHQTLSPIPDLKLLAFGLSLGKHFAR